MKAGRLESLLIAVICACCASVVKAAPSLFSDYGQIQNVQHYSSNPFWSPNSPYNQRLPQPVYVQGTDLDAGDCMQVVSSLVSAQCMARDNCKDTALNDIRPTIMVQLSGLPGNNYVSACSGFIDTAFESYVQQYANSLPNRTVDFPNGSVQNQNATGVTSPQKSKLPQWQQEIQERSDELQRLQAQNGAGYEHLSATDFPTTYADLSFSERMQNAAEGYVPFKDMKTYQNLNVKNSNEWCDEHPNSSKCTNNNNDDNNQHHNGSDDNDNDMQLNTRIGIMFLADGTKQIDDVIELNDSAINVSNPYFDANCSDHVIWMAISDDSAIQRASKRVFSDYGGDKGDFYIDFPSQNDPLIFPGLLHVAKGAGGSWTSPRTYAARIHNHIVMYTDMSTATSKINNLQQALLHSACSGLYIYLVALDIDETTGDIIPSIMGSSFEDNAIYTFWSNIQDSKIKRVKVLSDPLQIR